MTVRKTGIVKFNGDKSKQKPKSKSYIYRTRKIESDIFGILPEENQKNDGTEVFI